ncbi:HD domain-domain-containing protein [Yarrowia lipolytica]|nr:HD domain-containing protein [Yarrowia lipolytica]RDW54574.1 HD domain-domain-containing protein [Yarrowia lipolytica]SEI30771.1 YALIA101S01e07272g1_1 [Yarrowia lipolytica]VBB85796.1 Conserved hypothetical protein [Yarrowia lipolytica]
MSDWTPEGALPADLKEEIAAAATGTESLLAFLNVVERLKTTPRTGWLRYKMIDDPESIADHQYRMSIIAMLSLSPVNQNTCVKMALVHDMAEAIVGDITPFDDMTKAEKSRREHSSIIYMAALVEKYNPVAAKEIVDLWNQYENCSTDEARLVKDIDKFELMLQTYEYEKQHKFAEDLSQFYTLRGVIKTEEIGKLADELLRKRQLAMNKLGVKWD